jgi:hypothetical protein
VRPKFIVDANVGKLAKWLRILGYDAVFINGLSDDELIRIAINEGRVLLTKDTGIFRRGVVYSGELKLILINDDEVKEQLLQVVQALNLDVFEPFSLCLECNQPLVPRDKEEIRDSVPPYVFQTQNQYMQCPSCHRIYWRGTHWQRMREELEKLIEKRGSYGFQKHHPEKERFGSVAHHQQTSAQCDKYRDTKGDEHSADAVEG